jgi:hypothetical protein
VFYHIQLQFYTIHYYHEVVSIMDHRYNSRDNNIRTGSQYVTERRKPPRSNQIAPRTLLSVPAIALIRSYHHTLADLLKSIPILYRISVHQHSVQKAVTELLFSTIHHATLGTLSWQDIPAAIIFRRRTLIPRKSSFTALVMKNMMSRNTMKKIDENSDPGRSRRTARQGH